MIQLKNTLKALGIVALLALTFVSCARKANDNQPVQTKATETPQTLPLGAFSMSLNVKDLAASKLFYENLGFTSFGGGMEQNYLIMKNGNALIGLFQGMFEGNILTFNPGWDENAKNTASFTDVRDIQKHLKDKGQKLDLEADPTTKGPGSVMLTDPASRRVKLSLRLLRSCQTRGYNCRCNHRQKIRSNCRLAKFSDGNNYCSRFPRLGIFLCIRS